MLSSNHISPSGQKDVPKCRTDGRAGYGARLRYTLNHVVSNCNFLVTKVAWVRVPLCSVFLLFFSFTILNTINLAVDVVEDLFWWGEICGVTCDRG
jgi:hypothetical protein